MQKRKQVYVLMILSCLGYAILINLAVCRIIYTYITRIGAGQAVIHFRFFWTSHLIASSEM